MVIKTGNRIKQVLEEKGFQKVSLTDEKLIELGIDRLRFTRLINNYTQPTFSELKKISSWLNVDMDLLVNDDEKQESEKTLSA